MRGLLSVDVPFDGGAESGVDASTPPDAATVDVIVADVAPAPCAATVLASGGDPFSAMSAPVIDDTYVYWLQGNGPPATGYRVPKVGGATAQLCVTNGWEIFVDEDFLYWPTVNGSAKAELISA